MDPVSALRTMSPEMMGASGVGAGPAPLRVIPPAELEKLGAAQGAQAAGPANSFEQMLSSVVHDVSAKQAVANESVKGLMSGQNVPLHQAMIAVEEASLSFSLMVEVRNKLLESYQELMRMQV